MSTQKQRELWASYKYNHRCYLANDVERLQQTIRYRKIDPVDCIELIIALERLAAFDEFVKDTEIIFSLGGVKK